MKSSSPEPKSKSRESSPARESLSTRSLTLLVVASMIGAGVYTTSGFALSDLGSPAWVLVAWTLGGIIALCGAISYGGLAQQLCRNGGEYLYLSQFVHPSLGFIAGWISLLAGFTGAGAFAALAFESYALPGGSASAGAPAGTFAAALVLALTLVHCLPRHRGLWGQDTLVLLKLLTLAVFSIAALVLADRWTVVNDPRMLQLMPTPGWLDLATTVMWISLSYCGFNAAIYVAGSAKDGARSVARSMLLATALVTVIYLWLNALFVLAAPVPAVAGQKDVATVAADFLGGSGLTAVVRLVICLGLASSVSSVLVAGPRVYRRMAADGWFPAFVAGPHLDDDHASQPKRVVVAQGIGMLLVIFAADLRELLSYLSLTLSLSAAATVATLWKKQHRRRCGTGTLVASGIFLIATMVIAGLTAWHKPMEARAALATIVSGGVIYGLVTWFRSRRMVV